MEYLILFDNLFHIQGKIFLYERLPYWLQIFGIVAGFVNIFLVLLSNDNIFKVHYIAKINCTSYYSMHFPICFKDSCTPMVKDKKIIFKEWGMWLIIERKVRYSRTYYTADN